MKNSLHIFGDSFSLGDGCLPGDEYWKVTNGDGKIWAKLLSNNLGLKLKMYATRGASNQEILRKINQNLYRINKNDIVIIGISDYFRFEFYRDMKYYRVLFDTFANVHDIENLTYVDDTIVDEKWKHALEEYTKYVHLPNNLLYINSLNESIKSISDFLNKNSIQTIMWTWDTTVKIPYISYIPLHDEDSIYYEYPNIQDMHYSWSGHQNIYKKISNLLKK